MITFSCTKKEFINFCLADNGDTIANKVAVSMRNAGISYFDDAQKNAWKNSLPPMAQILKKTKLPDDVIVAAEYTICQAKDRLDFVITGRDAQETKNVIIVELKQLSTVQKSQKDDFVLVNVAHGIITDHWHPSYQAQNYANIISHTYQIVQGEHIVMKACSYLHNVSQEHAALMKDATRFPLLEEAPCFLKDDVDDFVKFIDSHIVKTDVSLLSDLDSSKIVPSRQLADMLLNALHGNPFYSYDEAQATAVATIKEAVADTLHYHEHRVIIIKGGAGTGKSIVALNVLGQLTHPVRGRRTRYNAIYCTANAAPRMLYANELIQGDFNRAQLRNFFKFPSVFTEIGQNGFDCALFDEAHRLFDWRPGVGIPRHIHILENAIKGTRVSVFFIDEDQIVTKDDYATIDKIRETSENLHRRVIEGPDLELTTQFRVLGGYQYIAFIKSFLGYNEQQIKYKQDTNYEFKVFDSAKDMQEAIREKDTLERRARVLDTGRNDVSGCCRMVAGYTYEWISKGLNRDDAETYDICFEDGFKAKWNLRLDEDAHYSWLDDPNSVDEVGCIHTAQGLDLKYCGVIIGKDMIYHDGQVKFDKTANARSDRASGIRNADDDLAEKLIRNTYNVLLTRGMKGTYVYCEDKELGKYLKSMVE